MKTNKAQNVRGFDHRIQVSPEELNEMIAVAAYYCAEQRGFAPGNELQDWLQATNAVDKMLDSMCSTGVTRGQFERVGLRNALRLWID